MNENKTPEGINAQLDQMGTMLENLAVIEANYYQSLITHGLSPEHALKVLMQWKQAWLNKMFGLGTTL